MAVCLTIEELSSEVFQVYYECLLEIHGVAYADFVLGSPREVVIPYLDSETVYQSYRSQTCALCKTAIADSNKEDCSFELQNPTCVRSDVKEAKVFFLCGACQ